MKKLSKKVLSFFLAAIMLLTVAPFAGISLTAKADGTGGGPQIVYSGDYALDVVDDKTAYIFSYDGEKSDLIIPSIIEGYTICGIDPDAFADCETLESVIIPEGVTTIGYDAFSRCSNLKTISLPNSLTIIGSSAFYNCRKLINLELPDNLTSIGVEAFNSCKGLTTIRIPNRVTDLGDKAFCFCDGLTSIIIPESVTSIGYATFAYCTDLTDVTIPNSITSIDQDAFFGCFSLKSVTIPKSVTNFGIRALGYSDYDTPTTGFTIYGYTGTAAETYANENGFTFIPLEEKEIKDETSGISVIYFDDAYDNDIKLNVSVVTDGNAFNILNNEKGSFKKSLFDITTTIDGKTVQPKENVFVKIPLPEGYNAEKTVVYYVTNDGKLEKIESEVKDGYIIFETNHFSFYAVVDESSTVNPSQNCSCNCHKKGFAKFIFKLILVFQKIFKKNKVCKCGINHY